MSRMGTPLAIVASILSAAVLPAAAQGIAQDNIIRSALSLPKEAIKVHDRIYQATGFGNTYLVTTPEGNVVIDTSNSAFAAGHYRLLRGVSDAPVRAIMLTHGHPDHVGGIARWREKETEVIAQEIFPKFRDYQRRLTGLFDRRNAAQYNLPPALVARAAKEYLSPRYDASITFDKNYTYKLGDLTFELHHTPGETQDQIAVWIPELKAAFIGDNMYETFPNMYTLRGTEFRSPIDWMESLELILSWEPEYLLGSHLLPITGKEEIRERLTKYLDAIRYVHDETVRGMNEGKDVYTLMSEIKLPPELAMGEQYGKVSWTVRGIYEGYVGWFDERPVDMYAPGPAAVYPDLVRLAGGPGAMVERAHEHAQAGRLVEALQLLEVVLGAEPTERSALAERINVYRALLERADNVIEQGWLRYGIRQDEAALRAAEPTPSESKSSS